MLSILYQLFIITGIWMDCNCLTALPSGDCNFSNEVQINFSREFQNIEFEEVNPEEIIKGTLLLA